jgi:hypothetical protein
MKKFFLFEFGFWAESSTQPSQPPRAHTTCVAQSAGATAQWFTGMHPCSEAEFDPLSDSD